MNPSKITKNTHFICGPFSKTLDMKSAIKDFSSKEEVLNSLGIKTFNPLIIYSQIDIEGFSSENFLKCQVSCLAMCDVVITLPNWEICETSNKFIEIARIMNKEIIPYSKFILSNTGNHGSC